jgi:hypothetical protein
VHISPIFAAVTVGVCVSLAATPSEETYCFGRLGGRLTARDLEKISQATGGKQRPWAVLGTYSQVLPETWFVDAFLPPTRSTGTIRRGVVTHLECKPKNGTCLEWHAQPKPGEYLQVADGRAFDESLAVRRTSERPILIDGEFSDQDLLSLVLFIRTRPAPRGANSVMRISGERPIMAIERTNDASVWVRMSDDGVSGETATVRKTSAGWQVIEVTMWIA